MELADRGTLFRDDIGDLSLAAQAKLRRVLEAVGWNKKEAARVLDISRGTLYRKILEYTLEPHSGSAPRSESAHEL